ncbi:MAG: S41 family peptidase [Clostridia bacterium]|nr:S41 family peptidase [Clostridia bacterium]
MNKKISIGTAIVVIALAVLITFQLTYISVNNKYEKALNELKDTQLLYDKLASVDSAYRTNYIGEIDEGKLIDSVLKGYVDGTGDKYGAYYNKDEFAEIVKDSNAELVGIGVNVIYDYDYGAIRVVNVMPDSPALEAGMMPGDLIAYIGDELISEIGYSTALSKIRGEEKTYVELTVLRGGSLIELEIERRKITDYTVYSRVYSKDPTVGIIQILEFDAGTAQQFKAAVKELTAKGVEKLVFDVRNNPGGNLDSIDEVLDHLLPEGTIIRIYDAAGNEETLASDAECVDMPMMVLVNSHTASAAELFSGALRDYGKAKLVGETTYGKGTMQTIMPLYDGSAISVSKNMYAPPVSDNYEGVGLTPDIEISLPEEIMNKSVFLLTDDEDTQLIAAVEEFANNQ